MEVYVLAWESGSYSMSVEGVFATPEAAKETLAAAALALGALGDEDAWTIRPLVAGDDGGGCSW